jgi:hypothetical protein
LKHALKQLIRNIADRMADFSSPEGNLAKNRVLEIMGAMND